MTLQLNPGSGGQRLGTTIIEGKHYQNVTDFPLEVSRGAIPRHTRLGTYANAPNGVQTTLTDIWPRADGTGGQQQIYIAPTGPIKHRINSTSADDDVSQNGAKRVRVIGLRDWQTPQITEDIDMAGTSFVTMVNELVIINNMYVLEWGSLGPNVGTIVAEAFGAGNTISSQINIGTGYARSSIVGIPRGAVYYPSSIFCSISDDDQTDYRVNFVVNLNTQPEITPDIFVPAWEWGVRSTGNTTYQHQFGTPPPTRGPQIIKISATSSKNDANASAGYEGILAYE